LFVVLRLSVNASRIGEQFFLTDVFYGCFLAILHGVVLAKFGVFIAFYTFPKTSNAFPNITMDVQRLN
jgi:hypothetical protein